MAIYFKISDLDGIPDSVSDSQKAEFLSCVWDSFLSLQNHCKMCVLIDGVPLHVAGGLKLNDHCGPFQPIL